MNQFGRVAAIALSIAVFVCGVCATVAKADFRPGEAIVVFDEEVQPAITFGDSIETEHAALATLFETYGLEDATALYTTASPLQNVYLLKFRACQNFCVTDPLSSAT